MLTGAMYSSVPTKELDEATGSAKNTGCSQFTPLDLRFVVVDDDFGRLISFLFLFVLDSIGSIICINWLLPQDALQSINHEAQPAGPLESI